MSPVALVTADLDQNRRLKFEPALVVMLDAIAVFARSELRKRPFPRIQAIALLLHLDLIGARLVGDLEQLLEQAIGALFARASLRRMRGRHDTVRSIASQAADKRCV